MRWSVASKNGAAALLCSLVIVCKLMDGIAVMPVHTQHQHKQPTGLFACHAGSNHGMATEMKRPLCRDRGCLVGWTGLGAPALTCGRSLRATLPLRSGPNSPLGCSPAMQVQIMGWPLKLNGPFAGTVDVWSAGQDLNLRPLDPQSSALPNCATSRSSFFATCL